MDENDRRPSAEGTDGSADDVAEARLRAADPAATAVPDERALRAAVDARIADGTGDAAAGAGARDELADRRARRWTGWPARVAGVAAAALLVGGGGGYAIGAAGPGTPAPAADVITAGGGMSAAPEAATGAGGMAAASDAAGGRLMAGDLAWGGWGRTVFRASGLPTDGGRAPAWGFDPAAAFTQETVASAAAALGVAGEAELLDGVWSVGPRDGSAAGVTLYPDGTASFNYYDPAKDPWACVGPDAPTSGDAATSGPATSGPAGEGSSGASDVTEPSIALPEPQPCALGDAPRGEAAVAVVRDALAALGLDPAGFELVAEDYGDAAWTYVNAHQVVGGQRTGLAWNASLTGGGLQSLYGPLAPAVELGEYDVVSPTEAVERLGDPRFGNGWGGPVRHLEEEPGAMVEVPAEPATPELPTTPHAGASFAWPVTEVTIVDFRLGSALHTLPGGAAALLPTYELISGDGAVWTVLAVAESALDLEPSR